MDGLNQLRTAAMINAIRNPNSSPEPTLSENTEGEESDETTTVDETESHETTPDPEEESPSDEA